MDVDPDDDDGQLQTLARLRQARPARVDDPDASARASRTRATRSATAGTSTRRAAHPTRPTARRRAGRRLDRRPAARQPHLVWGERDRAPRPPRGRGTGRLLVEEVDAAHARAGPDDALGSAPPRTTRARRPSSSGSASCYASHDARRRQGSPTSTRPRSTGSSGGGPAGGGRLRPRTRYVPPHDDALLARLVDVTAAINDAPMGDADLSRHEVFDLAAAARLETCLGGRAGDTVYRDRGPAPRDRRDRAVTPLLACNPLRPHVGRPGRHGRVPRAPRAPPRARCSRSR